MATESIGALIPTAIPGYADAADIQAALRAYHYGSYDYNPANTSPASLVNPSIAFTLNYIQEQINTLGGAGIPENIFTGKGQLISASASSTPLILSAGNNNQILVANNATGTGLQWTSTLISPTLTSPIVDGFGIIFEGTTVNDFETTLTVVDPTADRTITIPDSSGTVVLDSTTQTLTNKTLSAPAINLSINEQTSDVYTFSLTDNGKLVTFSNTSSITVTVPPNSLAPYPIGAQINFVQMDVGQVNVVGDIGVEVYGTPGLKLREAYSAATLIKLNIDTWLLTGDLSE